MKHDSKTISRAVFDEKLQSYASTVPAKLADLEKQRLETIPHALAEREAPLLTKAEVQTLVDWKLAHGTFRPSLQKLVASNSDETVEEVTRDAYRVYKQDGDAWDRAITMLAKLRGVGPATASLLLNVYDSDNVPFFSDELFRWIMFEDKKGGGWDRKIKYSMGEYKEMFQLVREMKERLDEGKDGKGKVSALEAEMVAYVLGREGEGEESKEGTKQGTKRPSEEEIGNAGESPPRAVEDATANKRRKLRSSG